MPDKNPIELTSQIAKESDSIIACLVMYDDPVKAIVDLYNQAQDKEVFTGALAATLLQRHRQWQAASGASAKT